MLHRQMVDLSQNSVGGAMHINWICVHAHPGTVCGECFHFIKQNEERMMISLFGNRRKQIEHSALAFSEG